MRISDWSSDVCSSDLASGQVKIKVTAVDAGGRSRQQIFDLDVTAVADMPTLSLVSSTGNTLEHAGGIAISLEATLADTDGSEVIDTITISNVPAGISFNQGVNLVGGVWQFEAQRDRKSTRLNSSH